MAFKFNWPAFDDEFYKDAVGQIESALNKGAKPPHIVDDILVSELFLGTVPPSLEILEISDIGLDRFKGIFRMNYSGDAYLVLQTKVQVNPVTPSSSQMPKARPTIGIVNSYGANGMVNAHKPLVVPMQLRICDIMMDAIFYLSVSVTKGLSLSFKNDPIQQIYVMSTFDDMPSVRDMLQNEIEKQIRSVLVEEMPRVLHEQSLRWVQKGLSMSMDSVESGNNDTMTSSVGVSSNTVDSGVGKTSEEAVLLDKVIDDEEQIAAESPTRVSPVLAHSFPVFTAATSNNIASGHNRPSWRFPFKSQDKLKINTQNLNSSSRSIKSVPVQKTTASSPLSPTFIRYNNSTTSIQRKSYNVPEDSFTNKNKRLGRQPSQRKRYSSSMSVPLSPFVGLHPANLKSPNSPAHIRTRTEN
ncbi:hypothetical protein MP638_000180 [Amoeboaphelidium occidentale]|nr:hypothetical protein MP638_000180 [Amoeboaphelidium occidentale]